MLRKTMRQVSVQKSNVFASNLSRFPSVSAGDKCLSGVLHVCMRAFRCLRAYIPRILHVEPLTVAVPSVEMRVRARVYMRTDVYGYMSVTTTVASASVSLRYATFEFVCQDVGQSLACA